MELATAVAQALGLADEESSQVAQVALLHDVGKLGVPEAILQKPGALSDAEWRIVRAHPAIGERVVASIPSLAHLAPAVRAEHERWDGSGYPDGLAGAADPAREPHLPGLRRLARDDLRPARTAPRCRAEPRAPSCSAPRRQPVLPAHGRRAAHRARRPPGGRPRAARARDTDRTAQPESELRALIAVAGAVAAAHRLEDVLEVVAEETRRVVGASSVSISRWEREHDRVRTLINVGELGPGEERFPTGETYELADYPLAARLLRDGESYVDLARRRRPRARTTASCSTRSTRAPTSASR